MTSPKCFVVIISMFVLSFNGANGHDKKQGEACVLDSTSKAGVCTHISKCPKVLAEAFEGTPPQVCSYAGTVAVVCCPEDGPKTSCAPLDKSLVTVPRTGSRARDYCISLAEVAFPCNETDWTRGNICPKVPARNQTDKRVITGDFPHLAALSYDDDMNKKGFVWHHLASLITDQWVLSDYYCTNLAKFVKLGGLKWNEYSDRSLVFSIISKVFHPDSGGVDGDYNRVGLIKLDRKVTFSPVLFPACLHTGGAFNENQLSYISQENNVYTRWNMRPVSYEECTDVIIRPVRNATQMCVTRVKEGGVETGISGGPLQVNNDESVACTQLIVAIHATEEPTKTVLLTTRVYGVLAWIESVVWP